MKKLKRYVGEAEALFFYWLGYRLFTTVLRGRQIGHSRPLSAARDYLRLESVPEGIERDAAEFLVDVAKIGRTNSLEAVFERWCDVARWDPPFSEAIADHARKKAGK